MSSAENRNTPGFNDLLRKAVRAEVECGNNWMGATATVADWLGVHPDTVRLRYRDQVVGPPRRPGLADGCWRLLARIAERERVWLERLEADVDRRRDELQLTLPLEPMDADAPRTVGRDARRVAGAERDLAAAKKAMGDFRRAERRKALK